MLWKLNLHGGKGNLFMYIINQCPALNLLPYILTSLKLHHCLNVIIFLNIFVHVHIYFLISKNEQTSKKNKNTRKEKEAKEEKRISPESRLENIYLWPPEWRFLAANFPETRAFFLWSWHKEKQQKFLQVGIIILSVRSQAGPKNPK